MTAKELVKIEGKSKETIERRFSSTFNLVKVRIGGRRSIRVLLIVVVIGSFHVDRGENRHSFVIYFS